MTVKPFGTARICDETSLRALQHTGTLSAMQAVPSRLYLTFVEFRLTAKRNPLMSRLWHQNAVIYQIDPTRFFDSNADGWGDLRGIVE
ncbi:glycosidase, partial [Cronobacter sakazakii]